VLHISFVILLESWYNINMSHERLLNSLQSASPVDKVNAALHDDPYGAGIITEQCPDALVASRLFNVATAAMDALRSEPESPLVEEYIDLPDPDDWLERFTLRLINDSVTRPHHPRLTQFRSGYMEKVGICALTEEKFVEVIESIDEQPEADEEPSTLFIDNAGRPVMFKKEYGQCSTITFRALQINRVRIPAGTIVNLEEAGSSVVAEQKNLRIAAVDPSKVTAIAPLRFSEFSFRADMRQEIMTPIEGFERQDGGALFFAEKTMSSLSNFFPDQKSLLRTYVELQRG
jgi:hypothetical protein